MDTKPLARRAAILFILSLTAFLPALSRLVDLTESGAVRRVDLVAVLGLGFLAGNLFSLAVTTLRARRAALAE